MSRAATRYFATVQDTPDVLAFDHARVYCLSEKTAAMDSLPPISASWSTRLKNNGLSGRNHSCRWALGPFMLVRRKRRIIYLRAIGDGATTRPRALR